MGLGVAVGKLPLTSAAQTPPPPPRPHVGKLVVAFYCRAVYSAESWPTRPLVSSSLEVKVGV